MAYQKGGKVQSTDLNTFSNTFNTIWGSGSANQGYGQTSTISTVNYGQKVRSTDFWNRLVTQIQSIASHQGTTVLDMIPSPTTAGKITFLQNINSNLTTINQFRLNAAASGSTSTTTATSSTTWDASMSVTFTITFANQNAARYYFNAGGQIGLNFSHPNTTGINALISDICAEAGTIWISSPTSGSINISGTNYNGVTKIGGVSSSRSTINSNYGFYSFNSTATQIFRQAGDTGPSQYIANSYMQILASSSNTGVITITCKFDEVPNGLSVNAGTVTNLLFRPPSINYLSDTWGTPNVISSFTYDNALPSTYSSPGTYNYTVPAGSSQIRVTYPSLSGPQATTVNVNPGQTYTVTIGNYGEGSSISGGVFSAPPWTVLALSFSGLVDSTCYIQQQVINWYGATWSGSGSAGYLNQGAQSAGIYYVEYNENNWGDLPSTVTVNLMRSTWILYAYRTHITYFSGRDGNTYIFQQPGIANNNVFGLYIQDAFGSAGSYGVQVSLQQIVGMQITPL